jgi:flavodoxin
MTVRSAKSLVVVASSHHKNTEKVAGVLANALGAEVQRPQDVEPEGLEEYGLVGFGSGIDSDKHYKALLDLADELPEINGKKAFIFSTCGIPAFIAGEGSVRKYSAKSHAALRQKLISRGYVVIGEFSCAGLNTNSFLGLFGGVNKGRPNAEDLGRAAQFARTLKAETECVRDSKNKR